MARRKKLLSKKQKPILLAGIAAVALVLSMLFPWGYTRDVSNVTDDIGLIAGVRLAAVVTGKGIPIDSTLPLTSLKIPSWIICLLAAAGAASVALKLGGKMKTSRLFCLITTGIALVFAVSLLLFLLNGGIQFGFLLLMVGAGLGFFISWKRA